MCVCVCVCVSHCQSEGQNHNTTNMKLGRLIKVPKISNRSKIQTR